MRSIQEIIDSVKPKKTYYCMEAMQWMIPDAPAARYLGPVCAPWSREAFAVHIDITNWVYSPKTYLYNREFIDEAFDLLGAGVRSCHLKDSKLHDGMTCLLEEVPVALGGLDIAHYIERAEALSPDTPMIIEHLTGDAAYREAVARVQGIARAAGVALRWPGPPGASKIQRSYSTSRKEEHTMIRLGICTSIDHAPILREIGYDYLELNMTQVAQMSEAAYAGLHAAVQSSPLPVEAMNSMIPAEYPLCAPRRGRASACARTCRRPSPARRRWACRSWSSAPAARAACRRA